MKAITIKNMEHGSTIVETSSLKMREFTKHHPKLTEGCNPTCGLQHAVVCTYFCFWLPLVSKRFWWTPSLIKRERTYQQRLSLGFQLGTSAESQISGYLSMWIGNPCWTPCWQNRLWPILEQTQHCRVQCFDWYAGHDKVRNPTWGLHAPWCCFIFSDFFLLHKDIEQLRHQVRMMHMPYERIGFEYMYVW